MVKDFLNKNTVTQNQQFKTKDFLLLAIPLVAGLFSVILNFWKVVFVDDPYLSYWSRVVVCLTLLVLLIIIIISKKNIYTPENGLLVPSVNTGELKFTLKQYTYSEAVRRFSKVLFIPLLLASVISIWLSLPRGLIYADYISGRVINTTSREPFSNVAVAIEGVAGDVVSKKIEILDEDGFFFCDLKWWASKPKYIVIESAGCVTKKILLSASVIYQKKPFAASSWVTTCLE